MRLQRECARGGATVDVVRQGTEHRATVGRELVEGDLLASHHAAQAHACPGDDLRDRVGADPELGSDLGVRVAVDISQRQCASLTPCQQRGATAHEATLLDEERRPLRIAFELIVGPDRRLEIVDEDLVRVPPLVPEHVPRSPVEVRRDIHPGRRIGKARHEADEDLLHEVVSGGRVGRQSQALATEARRMQLVEGLDRRCADRAGGTPGLHSARHAPLLG